VSLVMGVASMPAIAGNGLNTIGFGAQSQGMAGADLAISRDVAAININPSGLTQIKGSALDISIDPYENVINHHQDQQGNDAKPHIPYGALLSGGYARHLPNSNLVAGIGFFIQGGAGLDYRNLATPFGTHDDLSAKFALVKLEPGLAWQVSDALSLGASASLNYSQARQKTLPNTSYNDASDPNQSFYGFRVDSLSGFSMSGKLGFQYRPSAQWVIGGAYSSKSQLKLRNGKATFDYDALGYGKVTYRDASQSGLAVAQEAGIGVAYLPNQDLLVSAEINWVDGSSALKSTTLTVSNPDNNQLPQELQNRSLTSPLDWRDQYVMAIGAEYRWSELTTLRGGVNYGRNPIPARTLTPTLSLIGETSIAAGFSRHLSEKWELNATVWYQLPIKVRYTNPQSLFGPNASESWDGLVGSVTLSRRW